MAVSDPFDRKLDVNKNLQDHIRQGLIDTNDTLDFMWASARSVFGKDAKPEHAIALLPFALGQIAARRREEEAARQPHTDDEPTPEPRRRAPVKGR